MKMSRSYKIVLTGLFAVIALLHFNCVNNSAGTGTETENVTAMLYNPGGTPAAHVKVRFYPIHYNPRTGGLAKNLATTVDSATTDAAGNYTVKLDTGTYNVLAASDSGVVYQDSITMGTDSTIHPPSDTLRQPGGLRGRVRLQPGDDARTVFILFMGTNTWGIPDDSIGKFTVRGLAEGTYRVRILSWLDAYVPKDTVLSVTAGRVDSLTHDIVLQYTGIPGPTGLRISYDTLRQTVFLSWDAADTSLISGYNVYRSIKGQNFSLITQTPLPDTVTTYRDSTVSVGSTYAYRIVSWMASGEESRKVNNPGDTVKAVSSSLVTSVVTVNFNKTIHDSGSINDTIQICAAYSNPTRKIEKIAWYADSINSPMVRQIADSSLAGKDTLVYWWKQAGNKNLFICVTDEAATAWIYKFMVTIVQDVPVPNAGKDTTVSVNDTIRLHGSAMQKFGTIVEWAWDVGNTGTFIATGKGDSTVIAPKIENRNFYCILRVTDDDGNVAKDTVKIAVVQDAPVANAGRDTTVHMGTYVTLQGKATQQFGSIAKWEWNIDGVGFKETSSSDTTIPAPGTSEKPMPCILRVTDDDGNTGTDTVVLTAGIWELVGAGAFSDGRAPYFSLAIDNGIPYAAFQDCGNGDKATVMRYSGTAWEPAGTKGFSGGPSIYQSLAIDKGVPYVAFCDVANGYNTTVMRYSGTAWEPVGAKGFSDGCGYTRFLAIDNGAPYVTFRDAGNGGNISVMRYNGTAWEPVGAKGFSDGTTSFQSLAIDHGVLYVAFCDIENGYKTTVMRYNGTAWEPVGAKGFSDGDASFQSLAIDHGVPYVAFQDGANGKRTTVMRYNGTAWEPVGVKGFSDGASSYQSFAIDNGNPFVAFIDVANGNKPTVMRYNGTAWKPVGKKWASDNSSDFLSLAVDKGIIYVAIQSPDGKAMVMKFW
jgi:hypothetical protein